MNINLETAKDTLCKNILIYGYCKYENKGCVFSHNRAVKEPTPAAPAPSLQPQSNAALATASKMAVLHAAQKSGVAPSESKRKFNLNTPSFQPSVLGLTNKFSTLSPRVKEIPIFVPLAPTSAGSNSAPNSVDAPVVEDEPKKFNALTPLFLPFQGNGILDSANGSSVSLTGDVNPYLPTSVPLASASLDMYFSQPQAANYPLQYHLYAPAPPPRMTIPRPPYATNVHDMFIPNDLREQLQKKNEATLQTIPRSNLPDHINVYHSLVPIDKTYEPTSSVWGVGSAVYKVFSNADGNAYVMRKLDLRAEITNDTPLRNIKRWKKVRSSVVAAVQDCFTSTAFGSSALFVVYDYYPNSSTLLELHRKGGLAVEPVTEEIVWSYMVQLTNALVSVHELGLAVGSCLDLTKIIVTGKNRVRLSGVGIEEIIAFLEEHSAPSPQEDAQKLGAVLLELCTYTLPPTLRGHEPAKLVEYLKSSLTVRFSEELTNALKELASGSVTDMAQFAQQYLTKRMLRTLDDAYDAGDYAEAQLQNEIENARLFRLLSKLNFVIDRPEMMADMGETGNKYVIKLFRDYVFFQTDETGAPSVDLAHVLTCLNKLDAGIEEKIMLVSRDEKSCIIVSYKEVKELVDLTFRALR